MKVEKLLGKNDRDIESILPCETILEGAMKMAACKIGLLVVCDEEERIVGVFSERDLVRVIGLHGKIAMDRKFDTAMTSDVQVCNPKDDIQDVMSAMAKGQFRHMPVINYGTLCGMVSTADILKFLADEVTANERVLFWSKIAWV